MKKGGATELDTFYPIRPECKDDVPNTRFKPRAGKTLSARRWNASFSRDGHLDIAKVLRRIQRGTPGFYFILTPKRNHAIGPAKFTVNGNLTKHQEHLSFMPSSVMFQFVANKLQVLKDLEGIHPSIKGAVWEFLLGCYDPNSTFDDRNQLRQKRREQYSAWKAECHKMVPVIGSGKFIMTPIINEDGQPVDDSAAYSELQHKNGYDTSDMNVIQWKLLLHQIGLDVVRTDQALVFYQNETNQAKLWDVLAIYAWVDSDIGYVQGMNDICSPMIILLEDETDSFWCFERAMRRLRENFRSSATSIGVQSQLSTLSQIVKTIDPKLHQHLEDLDGGEYLFAFRMLMVLLRREFSFADALYLWELMWAMEYKPNIFSLYEEPDSDVEKAALAPISGKMLKQYGKFERNNVQIGCIDQQSALVVFLVASVLETKNKKILNEAKGLDDVVQILNDITGNLDAKKACKEALKIQKKYLSKANHS